MVPPAGHYAHSTFRYSRDMVRAMSCREGEVLRSRFCPTSKPLCPCPAVNEPAARSLASGRVPSHKAFCRYTRISGAWCYDQTPACLWTTRSASFVARRSASRSGSTCVRLRCVLGHLHPIGRPRRRCRAGLEVCRPTSTRSAPFLEHPALSRVTRMRGQSGGPGRGPGE